MLPFNTLKKNLKKDFSPLKTIRLAIVADSASQLMHQAIKGWGYEAGIHFDIYEADYNQVDLQVFDPSSELYAFDPEFIFISRSAEHLLKDFYKKGKAGRSSFAVDQATYVQSLYDTLLQRLSCRLITNTLVEINDSVFGNYASKMEESFLYQVRKTNLALMDLARANKNVFLCDVAALQAHLGYTFVFDPKMYVNADMTFSIDFLPYLAKHLTDIIRSVTGSFKKCLILDLDNTTWGGIIGDDGIEGIQVGDLGIGKSYTELQLWAKELKQRGVIIAVCSKNTEEIAKEAFEKHPDMVLRLEDIAVFVANWETKVDNIRAIQSILNIGFDSMVFLDDNPFEREIVKQHIPELTVPELPEDPAEYVSFLRTQNLFETASYTEEDEQRTQQYQEEAKRNVFEKSFTNEADFLQTLNMRSVAKPFDAFTTPRVAQLTQRSNQFNLRTVRYTEEDIKQLAASDDHFTLSFTLEDQFGDHGLIALVILKKTDANELFIDSWIMSCRVLKRGMENFTLNTIAEIAKANGFTRITGEYLPTKKNGIVKDHYATLGFRAHGDSRWTLDLNDYTDRTTYIQLKN